MTLTKVWTGTWVDLDDVQAIVARKGGEEKFEIYCSVQLVLRGARDPIAWSFATIEAAKEMADELAVACNQEKGDGC